MGEKKFIGQISYHEEKKIHSEIICTLAIFLNILVLCCLKDFTLIFAQSVIRVIFAVGKERAWEKASMYRDK